MYVYLDKFDPLCHNEIIIVGFIGPRQQPPPPHTHTATLLQTGDSENLLFQANVPKNAWRWNRWIHLINSVTVVTQQLPPRLGENSGWSTAVVLTSSSSLNNIGTQSHPDRSLVMENGISLCGIPDGWLWTTRPGSTRTPRWSELSAPIDDSRQMTSAVRDQSLSAWRTGCIRFLHSRVGKRFVHL